MNFVFGFIDVLKEFFPRFGKFTSASVRVDRKTNRLKGKKEREKRKFELKHLFMFTSFICSFIFVFQLTYLFFSFLLNYDYFFVHTILFVSVPLKMNTHQAIALFYSFLHIVIYLNLALIISISLSAWCLFYF